ncbi:ER membrane protein complex subunit 2-A isoform X2 [Calliopsis andreniformis]|uniref:ER membrane protein complex subunit 2-A isoform X2 n=1 Tax=Calliopsis andreniformis TaxID=337506 RepID=UPI003FCD9182
MSECGMSERPLTMADQYAKLSWKEVRDLFRTWREDGERRSKDVVDLWELKLMGKIDQLGNEKYLVLEQVCLAALDCYRLPLAVHCIRILKREFPSSLRVYKYRAMHLEAVELYDEALELLDLIISRDETNAAPRKRRIAILKARGRTSEAIKELTEYLRKFMSDQEAWHELCDLYLQEQEYSKAAFCMEELILHNPHSHLIYQRYAEIKYSQGGFENMELAKAYFCQAAKLNPNNIRALYGLLLATNNIATSPKCPSSKKKDAIKLGEWAANQIEKQYKSKVSDEHIKTVEGLLGQLQLEV